MTTKIGSFANSFRERAEALTTDAPFALAENGGGRAAGATGPEEGREAALEKLQEAKESVSRTTFRMWDRHTEMVKKSQALNKAKIQKDAIERRNRQNRERQTELLAERAVENARRSQWLNNAALERRDRESID